MWFSFLLNSYFYSHGNYFLLHILFLKIFNSLTYHNFNYKNIYNLIFYFLITVNLKITFSSRIYYQYNLYYIQFTKIISLYFKFWKVFVTKNTTLLEMLCWMWQMGFFILINFSTFGTMLHKWYMLSKQD